jgi:hypothetical protein
LSPFWQAAHELDTDVDDESKLAGAREGHLAELFERAGLGEVADTALSLTIELASFDAWWEPFTHGVGPAGAYVASLDAEQQARLRELVATSSPRAIPCAGRARRHDPPPRPPARSATAAAVTRCRAPHDSVAASRTPPLRRRQDSALDCSGRWAVSDAVGRRRAMANACRFSTRSKETQRRSDGPT